MSEEKRNEELLERVTQPVSLLRRSGSFEKEGSTIEYCKYVIRVAGADLEINFQKDVKSLLGTFLKFEKV